MPSIQFHYVRLREEAGDDEVKVMRLPARCGTAKVHRAVEKLIPGRRVNALNELLRRCAIPPTLGAVTYAERLIANGVTLRTVREYSVLELVTSGLPVVLAKRAFKASRDLPETRDQEYGEDGVAVDARIWAGASFASRGPRNLDADALFEELHEIKEEERRKRLAQMALGLGDPRGGGGGPGRRCSGARGAAAAAAAAARRAPTAGGEGGLAERGAAQLRRIPSVRGPGAPQRSSKHSDARRRRDSGKCGDFVNYSCLSRVVMSSLRRSVRRRGSRGPRVPVLARRGGVGATRRRRSPPPRA